MSSDSRDLRKRFEEYIGSGKDISKIATQLGITMATAAQWRNSFLDSQSRSSDDLSNKAATRDWRDIPIKYQVRLNPGGQLSNREDSPRKILGLISSDLKLARGDVEAILQKSLRCVQLTHYTGKPFYLLLAQTYLYNRSSIAGRPTVGINQYVGVCNRAGLNVDKSSLQRLVRNLGTPTSKEPNASERIRRRKYVLKQDLGLGPSTIETSIQIADEAASNIKSFGKTPTSVALAAAAVYLATRCDGLAITQNQVSVSLGVSEVTLRNVIKKLIEIPEMKVLLQRLGLNL